jgi:hypothetical protein
MAATATVDGEFIQVKVNGVIVANGTGCKIEFKSGKRETTTKDGGRAKQYEYTMREWTVSGDILYADINGITGLSSLNSAMKNFTKIGVTCGSISSGGKFYSGNMVVDSLSIDAKQKDNATSSYSFTGDGDWTENTNP